MYYASPSPVGAVTQDKTGNIYIPGQAPASFAQAGQVGPPGAFAPPGAQQVLPNGLTAPPGARYAPQAYAVVSSPAGHPAYAPANVYSSMPYHPGMAAAIPTSSHAATAYHHHHPHLQTPQFHPGGISYHHQMAALAAATNAAGRPAHHHPHHPPPQPGHAPPQHYALSQPVQAGAPLFAAGYSPLPAGASATTTHPGATRPIAMGPTTAGAAAFPPGFAAAFPGQSSSEGTAGAQQVAYTPAGYVAQF